MKSLQKQFDMESFRTTNESEHLTTNQFRDLFISNEIFDLGLQSSDTTIHLRFFSQQIKYLTFSWNFPRVEIKFDSSFL